MNKKIITLLFSLCSGLIVADVNAATIADYPKLCKLYPFPAYWYYCAGDANDVNQWFSHWNGLPERPCIGSSADENGNCLGSWKAVRTPQFGDEFGKIMMAAYWVEPNGNGAQFCPYSVIARNRRKDWAWTQYHSASGDCVVLCKNGFTGTDCQRKITDPLASCDGRNITWESYKNATLTDGISRYNAEDHISMWGANARQRCGTGYDQEHDLIFAISHWLPSGNGAWARPYMIRAYHDGDSEIISGIIMYPATNTQYKAYGAADYSTYAAEPMLLCKDGFKYNADGTDCVPIDDKNPICKATWCEGWDKSKYDPNVFSVSLVTTKSCLQWRCAVVTDALDAAGGTKCSPCITNAKDGVDPETGMCVHCGKGKIFNPNDPINGFCSTASTASKLVLKYGPGNTKDTAISKQCWTKDTVDDYKLCVQGE